jgi:hypothetical protein
MRWAILLLGLALPASVRAQQPAPAPLSASENGGRAGRAGMMQGVWAGYFRL